MIKNEKSILLEHQAWRKELRTLVSLRELVNSENLKKCSVQHFI